MVTSFAFESFSLLNLCAHVPFQLLCDHTYTAFIIQTRYMLTWGNSACETLFNGWLWLAGLQR